MKGWELHHRLLNNNNSTTEKLDGEEVKISVLTAKENINRDIILSSGTFTNTEKVDKNSQPTQESSSSGLSNKNNLILHDIN